jgi:hypothetical protein
VPQPVPRLARQAAMPGMHRRVMSGYRLKRPGQ